MLPQDAVGESSSAERRPKEQSKQVLPAIAKHAGVPTLAQQRRAYWAARACLNTLLQLLGGAKLSGAFPADQM